MTTQSVLIVDDEPDIRELLDITLSRMGLDTFTAADLGEARARLAEHQPNLCLTDMRLPDGNGISLVEHIQEEFPHIPVAMITAHGSVEAAIAALKAGAVDSVVEPDHLRAAALATLQRAIDGKLDYQSAFASCKVDFACKGTGRGRSRALPLLCRRDIGGTKRKNDCRPAERQGEIQLHF